MYGKYHKPFLAGNNENLYRWTVYWRLYCKDIILFKLVCKFDAIQNHIQDGSFEVLNGL